MNTNPFRDYFRCGAGIADIGVSGDVSPDAGFFTFGAATCYGRPAGAKPAKNATEPLPDVSASVARDASNRLALPFDLAEVVANLQQERYAVTPHHYLERITAARAARAIYYFLRPALPVRVRRHLQKIRLAGWDRIAFPRWPVDTTVETLMRTTLALAAERHGLRHVPFIWFWPDGAKACAVMTHDVEGPAGEQFCGELMDLDESYGIPAAFQLVPEVRAGNSKNLLKEIRQRGFEVNLHDLNHDGYLFGDRERFLARAARINSYAREFECKGFRSGAMYRDQGWYDAFEFSYDMSVPNVAHLEPQRGGCCTVMPYFIGRVLELPSTTVQDYSLFHILGDYSIRLWQQQCEQILSQNGLMTFITHPDYLIEPRARAVYGELLRYLDGLRSEQNVWIAAPGEVDSWWRNRSQMKLVADGGSWRIDGPGSERARVAYATVIGDQVVYEADPMVPGRPAVSA